MTAQIEIDGAYGEGGGQVLRTSLTLAAITGQPVHLRNIRAARRNPGLAPQHLTGVLAVAEVCRAEVEGAQLGSTDLIFRPGSRPVAGEYTFDVSLARQGGSAGAVSLIFETLVLPLALAEGESQLTLKGGTHVPMSPSYHYLAGVFMPMLERLGVSAELSLDAWGFYPAGDGQITALIAEVRAPLAPLTLPSRSRLRRLRGVAAAANLPSHIPQRMANRARSFLRENGVSAEITPVRERSAGPGAGTFLAAEFENAMAGFEALGEKGKPSERVAEEACLDFLAFQNHSEAAVDMHLADQLLLPLALAQGASEYTTCRVTNHLLTNAYIIQQFIDAQIEVTGEEGEAGSIKVSGVSPSQ